MLGAHLPGGRSVRLAADGRLRQRHLFNHLHEIAGIPLATTATILVLGRIFEVLEVILSGPLADLLKCKTMAYAAIAITTILSFPFVLAVVGKRVLWVIILDCLMTFF